MDSEITNAMNIYDKKTVLIDMDGVICDYTGRILDLATKRFNLPRYAAKHVGEFYTERVFPKNYQKLVDELSLEKGFFLKLKPLPFAKKAVEQLLADTRFSVWICSAPKKTSPYCHSEKFLWLRNHFGQGVAERLILTRDKTLVRGDYLIDDKPTIEGENPTPSWKHVIFDQPYNRTVMGAKRLTWPTWKSVLK